MINYAISTFNVIVLIGKVEAKVEKFRRRSTGKGSGGGKHSLVLTFCLSQGHPTAIFGKYLFGRRFEN